MKIYINNKNVRTELIGKDELTTVIDSLWRSREHYKSRLNTVPKDVYLLEKVYRIDKLLDEFTNEVGLTKCI